jgi:uroporphyrinogen-III synthase
VGIRRVVRPVFLVSKTPYPGVIHIPVLSIRFLTPPIDFSQYDGIVFTSKQGIEALHNYDVEWKELQCVCVSEPTAEHARRAGVANVVAGNGYGESLPDVLGRFGTRKRWLYLRPETVASDWAEHARNEKGISVDEAIVYETVCNADSGGIEVPEDAVLVFTSPSSVRCYLERYALLDTHTVVAIGTTTEKSLPKGIAARTSAETSVSSAVKLACEIAGADKK